MKTVLKCFIICFVLHFSLAANILVSDNLASPSHQIFNYGITEVLLERGHNITLLGPLTIAPLVHPNYTHIVIDDLHDNVMKDIVDFPDSSRMSTFELISIFLNYGTSCCKYSYQSKGFKTLLNYPEDFKFDAIIIDLTSESCFLHLIQRFGYPPTIGMTAFLLAPYLAQNMGGDLQPAYIPSYYTSYSSNMNFFQRFFNYFSYYLEIGTRRLIMDKQMQELAEEAFGKDIDSIKSLQNHISLLLVNWNPVLHYPQPVPPNVIPVAGVHIKPKPTDKEIQKILDNSKNGVILFSLGSNLRSDELIPEIRKEILDAFSKLKETVLWKFESDITGLPKNVVVRKWIPQNNVLQHSNTKLFISHGGGLSTIEATYFGVPVLGMPFFADQHNNIDTLIEKGLSRKIYYATLKAETFLENINEMLKSKYLEGMKELSRRFRDQPETPRERAAFWMEYAIKHNGSLFLSPKSRYLPLYVSSCTDIFLFIVIATVTILYGTYWVLSILFKSKNQKTKKKQKTN